MGKGQITAIIHENEKVVEIDSCVTNRYITVNDISFNEYHKKIIKNKQEYPINVKKLHS